jgi:hypothetical protein
MSYGSRYGGEVSWFPVVRRGRAAQRWRWAGLVATAIVAFWAGRQTTSVVVGGGHGPAGQEQTGKKSVEAVRHPTARQHARGFNAPDGGSGASGRGDGTVGAASASEAAPWISPEAGTVTGGSSSTAMGESIAKGPSAALPGTLPVRAETAVPKREAAAGVRGDPSSRVGLRAPDEALAPSRGGSAAWPRVINPDADHAAASQASPLPSPGLSPPSVVAPRSQAKSGQRARSEASRATGRRTTERNARLDGWSPGSHTPPRPSTRRDRPFAPDYDDMRYLLFGDR